MLLSQTVTLDFSESGIIKNETIKVFCDIKEITLVMRPKIPFRIR